MVTLTKTAGTHLTESVVPFFAEILTEINKITGKKLTATINPFTAEDGGTSTLAKFGNGETYINSIVSLFIDTEDNKTREFGRFTLSCFPNCCGKGIITAAYGNFGTSSFYHNAESISYIITLYCALFLAIKSGYTGLIAVDTTNSNNLDAYEKAQFKELERTYRKGAMGYEGTYKLITFSRNLYKVGRDSLFTELKKHLNIKKENEQPSNNILVNA